MFRREKGSRSSRVIAGFTLAIFLLPFFARAYSSPGKPIGFVNDFTAVISTQDHQAIESKLQSLQNSTGVQVVVVTIKSLGGDTIENYAVQLFKEWGIGVRGKDNGLLILVAPSDHEARIEVGYGLEGVITDLQSGLIVRNVMIPAFKTGDYSKGIGGAVDAVISIITKSPEAAGYLNAGNSSASGSGVDGSGERSSGSQVNFFGLFFFGVIVLNMLARILGKTKSWWLGGVIGGVIGAIIGLIFGFVMTGIVWIVVLTIIGLIFDYIVSKHPPGSGGKGPGGIWPFFLGGGRGGFGGSGGGGFGGFGGGMSGGGGASGRW